MIAVTGPSGSGTSTLEGESSAHCRDRFRYASRFGQLVPELGLFPIVGMP